MLRKAFARLLGGLCFALPLGLVTAAFVQASPQVQDAPPDDCQGCHRIIQTHWEESGHGQSMSDPVFLEAWDAQGKPDSCLACHASEFDEQTGTWAEESVACTVCHNPIPSDHPEQVMPTEISSRLCGQCHLDTFKEWQDSTHGQDGLTCVRCHNSHTTSIRATGVQELCQACHNEEVHFYSYTAHAEQGLLCVDCHLRVSESQVGEGHGERVHSFSVDLHTCNQCHGEQMHFPAASNAMEANAPLQAGLDFPFEETTLNEEANPVSPLGFAVVAALVGMAFGMLMSPWLERFYQRLRRDAE